MAETAPSATPKTTSEELPHSETPVETTIDSKQPETTVPEVEQPVTTPEANVPVKAADPETPVKTTIDPVQQPVTTPEANVPVKAAAPRAGSLFVSELSQTVTESDLLAFFSSIGDTAVSSIRVCRDKQHPERRSLGYAYVNFHNENDAKKAIESLSFEKICGKSCRISWSKRDPSLRKSGVGNLFIKNLDKEIDDVSLYDTFSYFGEILSSKIAFDKFDKTSKGYGFVHFKNFEDSQKAIEALNGKCLNGKQVYVGPFIPKNKRESKNSNNFSNIYIKNIHQDVTPEKYIEHLTNLTSDIGKIVSPKLMTKVTEIDGKMVEESRRFGFVDFGDHDVAVKVLERLKDQEKVNELAPGLTAEDKVLYSAEAIPKAMRKKLFQRNQNLNLFVKNISEDITEEKLSELFGKFGTITSLVIMEDEAGIKKGFGFVCYDNQESAKDAITGMNNTILGGKPLYVSLAQRKEDREQYLRQQRSARFHSSHYGYYGRGRMQGRPNFRVPSSAPIRYPNSGYQRHAPFIPQIPHPQMIPGRYLLDELEPLKPEDKIQKLGDIIFHQLISEGGNSEILKKVVGNLLEKAKEHNSTEDKVKFLLPFIYEPKARNQLVARAKPTL